jgi:glutamine---fructose-6-phosphate transaminase (isomerizing)
MDQTPSRHFDPEALLPGPPDPWRGSTMPAVRAGPPWAMTEMIAAEPALAERLLARLGDPGSEAAALAAALRECLASGRSVVLVGCGTSEHGAQGGALILAEAAGRAGLPPRVRAVQALEAALALPEAGLLLAVSHEGGTWATNRALEAARAAGVRTALITVGHRSPGATLADLVVATREQDQSWCHTVGYLSPLLVATAVAGHLTGAPAPTQRVRALITDSGRQEAHAEAIAAGLAGTGRLLTVGSGADRPAARELALKVEEACYLPTTMRDLETILHGHLPAMDATSGLVLLLAEREQREARLARARGVLAAAGAIGVRCAAIVAADADAALPDELTPLGRLVVPQAAELASSVATLLGTATPLQLLTERLARARGTNPDTLRRTDHRYRTAAAQVE